MFAYKLFQSQWFIGPATNVCLQTLSAPMELLCLLQMFALNLFQPQWYIVPATNVCFQTLSAPEDLQ